MDEGELDELIDLSQELKIQDNIEFVGQLDSDNKNCFKTCTMLNNAVSY